MIVINWERYGLIGYDIMGKIDGQDDYIYFKNHDNRYKMDVATNKVYLLDGYIFETKGETRWTPVELNVDSYSIV